MIMSKDELETSHKKALKSLDGEKRAAIKKAKGMKGEKGKEALAAVEEDFANRLKALETSYQQSLAALSIESLDISNDHSSPNVEKVSASDNISGGNGDNEEAAARERKRAKAKKKKDRQKQKEVDLERQIEEENANAGPGLRKIELEQIQAVLSPLKLKVSEVEADGHCLYRAIAAQAGTDYMAIRSLCADALSRHQEDFAPFCEYTDEISSFDHYLEKVRNSAEWGGHLELRALGIALNRPIYVYSVQSGAKPLAIHEDTEDETNGREPILLSYHLHYYALGEHYNQVVKE
mmetsp:Transcript_23538/g.65333  ORF Transcript_23538/g.65333 Transcript_23538/m.65333 type:complete len:293 (+) Transcript_23538:125-1003(+)